LPQLGELFSLRLELVLQVGLLEGFRKGVAGLVDREDGAQLIEECDALGLMRRYAVLKASQ
jgi:hypothetical protein